MSLIKTPEEIEIMREGGRILAEVLHEVKKMAKPGVATIELDRAAEALILSWGAKPAFKDYEGFPFSLCVSINENIVHGLPSDYILKEGDLVKLDLGVLHKGFNTDMAITVPMGKVANEAKKLMDVCRDSLEAGIKQAKIGNTTGDIGSAIEDVVRRQRFWVVKNLCGHGIGKEVHEDPQVANYGTKGMGEKLVEGMVICIEPMVALSDWRIKHSKDGYGYATKDGSLAAHFEHTIAITKKGPKILTQT